MSGAYLAIEIGGTKLQLVSSETPPQIDHRYRAQVDPTLGASGILAEIEKGIETLFPSSKPVAVGIGFGGPIDTARQRIARSHQIEGWDGFELGEWAQDRCRCPVRVDNDANVAALAEATFGAGRDFDPVFYVTLGSGVGGGLIRGKQIYHGAVPGESEIGHLRLTRQGDILENSCSGWAVDRKVRAAIEQEPESYLAQLVASNPTAAPAKALSPALTEGDRVAGQIVKSTADDLAFGLSHVVHLQHPEAIVLGGGLSLLGNPLLVAVQEALPGYLMETMLPGPRVLLAALAEDMVPMGALALAIHS